MSAPALAIVRSTRDLPGGIRQDLEIANASEHVPAIFLIPHSHEPVAAALLLHGFGSQKERIADTIGEALMRRGVAALAIDLPLHGARSGSPNDFAHTSPVELLDSWRTAVGEARLAIDFLASHDSVDAHRLGLVGYSLGSFLANVVAAETSDVRALALVASGDLPEGLPFESRVRAVIDPVRAARRVAGRPLLMVSGRFDRTVKPAQAERLFAGAREPKTMRWYGVGHWPPTGEIEYLAEWMSDRLRTHVASRVG